MFIFVFGEHLGRRHAIILGGATWNESAGPGVDRTGLHCL
jgi:hypothetical protein